MSLGHFIPSSILPLNQRKMINYSCVPEAARNEEALLLMVTRVLGILRIDVDG